LEVMARSALDGGATKTNKRKHTEALDHRKGAGLRHGR
jgi:hypothetical protein